MNHNGAREAYKEALKIKPGCVRVMVNIGLVLRNKGEFDEAIFWFLNALLLNPKAKHIWSYVESSLQQASKLETFKNML